jgi:starvation-inducible outer membrane lipoprotein
MRFLLLLLLLTGCSTIPEDPDIGDGQPTHPTTIIKFRPGENHDKK